MKFNMKKITDLKEEQSEEQSEDKGSVDSPDSPPLCLFHPRA